MTRANGRHVDDRVHDGVPNHSYDDDGHDDDQDDVDDAAEDEVWVCGDLFHVVPL